MKRDLTGVIFRKSGRSGSEGNCVEVADNLPEVVAVRDSKDRDGVMLTFTTDVWSSFVDAVRAGEFDV